MPKSCIVQLPFPSSHDPDPRLSNYYDDYDRRFRAFLPEYFIPSDGLWEMPLWVAHLTALLDTAGIDSVFRDLSRTPAEPDDCSEPLLAATAPGDLVLMSPLAQNFRLALDVAKHLEHAGRRVVLGGNMAPLAPDGAVHAVHRGQLDATFVRRLVGLASGAGGGLEKPLLPGLASERITWAPDYRHLGGYEGQVPLLRLNASHGCLYQCSFCGDAWSKQLTLVEKSALEQEVDELTARFPETRLFYIGDKTFGQSREAVANLLDVFRDRPGYRFIVQTHVMQVKDWIVDAMLELGVVAVELGFESADSQMLKRLNKLSRGLDDYTTKIHKLSDAGLKVVLNMMGGLDEETEAAHGQTVDWMRENSSALWLFNLYNFVPYPLTPDFPRLRERIFDWEFADWREDAPVVYRPQHLSPEASWDLFQEKIAAAHDIIRTPTTVPTSSAQE
ncbi:B12-binding domain-containing radical SAM protein [Actinacidiphila acididurans]|uniref:Radical SAM protein n=1 Tax=Actinacidiphila acididurans TaxID=2784346 RepID=A0ABS2TYS7_9ACTN|nr:radical SAM protein [Actinacidiphila acididurans]MBM9508487.1 radical SAM protein [Actinacidiphila acididurans]